MYKKALIFLFLITFILSKNIYCWDKINYLSSDNMATGGAIAGDLGDIDNIIINPSSAILNNNKIKAKFNGMKLFSSLDMGIYNYSLAFAYKFSYLTAGLFYGTLTSEIYSDSIFALSSAKEILNNLFVGLSFVLERKSFYVDESVSDPLLNSGTSYNKWYFNPGVSYKFNENFSAGFYISELFNSDFNIDEALFGVGIKHIFYRNSKSILQKGILKFDMFTIGGNYQNFKAGVKFILYKNYLNIEAGYNRNNITFGTGFNYLNYGLNFAYIFYNNITDFGSTIKGTIILKF